jgi:hypothetical protein
MQESDMYVDEEFVRSLMGIGIVSSREQENLFDIARRCASTLGVPGAGAGLVSGASIGGTVSLGALTLPAAVAGALAGLVSGTLACVMLNEGMKEQLRELARY